MLEAGVAAGLALITGFAALTNRLHRRIDLCRHRRSIRRQPEELQAPKQYGIESPKQSDPVAWRFHGRGAADRDGCIGNKRPGPECRHIPGAAAAEKPGNRFRPQFHRSVDAIPR